MKSPYFTAIIENRSSESGARITFTTASEYPLSPLLQARLEFLGVARSGDINIFMEISNLSGLSFHSTKYQDCTENQFSEIDYTNQKVSETKSTESEYLKDNKLCTNSCPTPSLSESLLSKEPSGKVLDRSAAGNICQVSYSFNTNTLKVYDCLHKFKIPYETEIYKPKEERLNVDSNIFYCKNLFLKDRKGQFYLVICHEDFNMDLKQLRKSVNANRNFNFGTADDMKQLLGTEPGGVTPLALINPNAADVKMVIHKSLVKEDASLMFHPLDLKLATKITLPSLLRYLKSCNHSPIFVK
ncbi:uncharacterized protein LOC128546138 [Mercenaria mercenaria]|uniref:uncharacterized protein LOC128546138 n=1 Tax=Mercenaria mercenaria TaxID=6596 RepID=UPI00234E6588|nr:uncharacterized protein LOC128546138 [Mercenaria mercenaria]